MQREKRAEGSTNVRPSSGWTKPRARLIVACAVALAVLAGGLLWTGAVKGETVEARNLMPWIELGSTG